MKACVQPTETCCTYKHQKYSHHRCSICAVIIFSQIAQHEKLKGHSNGWFMYYLNTQDHVTLILEDPKSKSRDHDKTATMHQSPRGTRARLEGWNKLCSTCCEAAKPSNCLYLQRLGPILPFFRVTTPLLVAQHLYIIPGYLLVFHCCCVECSGIEM